MHIMNIYTYSMDHSPSIKLSLQIHVHTCITLYYITGAGVQQRVAISPYPRGGLRHPAPAPAPRVRRCILRGGGGGGGGGDGTRDLHSAGKCGVAARAPRRVCVCGGGHTCMHACMHTSIHPYLHAGVAARAGGRCRPSPSSHTPRRPQPLPPVIFGGNAAANAPDFACHVAGGGRGGRA